MNAIQRAVRRTVAAILRGSDRRLRASCEFLESRVMLTAPIASNFNFNFESTHSLTVDFNMEVGQLLNPLANSDLTLEKLTTDANIPASSIQLDLAGTHAMFRFNNVPVSWPTR